ncbi:antibiotic synthetase, putative [Ricinus communis]|uniref:Antibiotic synthetase, putative n=1 Tax=Ricinus communis TaxID=3988 RepID=B9T920_RICCO|nr:antibiotic synthetase, putative [Ricinus communis]
MARWQRQADFGARNLGAQIARWAQQTPDVVAVVAPGVRWTYMELVARANRLGNWLNSRGVAPGTLVAMNLPRSPEMVVAILATWSAGAAYLPLEPEWPAARRAGVIADARPVLVLHPPGWSLPLTENEAILDLVDPQSYPSTPAVTPGSGDALAYVLYTSGSTGMPKGVVITHGALHNYVASVSQALNLPAVRRWGLTSTIAADLGNTALFGALYNGAMLAVASDAETRDGEAFSRFMAQYAIDGLKMVPSHLEALLDCAEPRLPGTLVLGAILWEGLPAPVQLVCRQAPLTLEWLQPGSDAHARLQGHVDPAHYRIDVRKAPLLRAIAVHDDAEQRWLLQLPSHNLVLDHTTQELLIEEIALIQQGRAAELPIPVPFRDFVARARQGVSEAEHERFMRSLLGDVEEPAAPFGVLDVQGDGVGVEELRLSLDTSLAADVRRVAQQLGVSPAAIFHLAWAAVLARTSGKDDVVFGTVMFGRMQGGAGIERALGMFINTLPVRARLRGRSVINALRDMHALLTELLHHEHASLTLAQRCSGLAAGTPLFSALFNYRYSPRAEEGAQPILQGMQVLGGGERTSYPYTLSVDDLGRGYGLVLQVTERVGAQRMADYMVAALRTLSEALEHAPALMIEALPLAPQAEVAELQWLGVNDRRYPDQETVLQLFEREASAYPDAPALLHGDETLSYAQLNRRVNRLAHHLIALGVRPETPVGVALERSTGMIVGLLAILKAGGAYVPLDPDYPQERLAAMIADSGMPLLLTQTSAVARIPAPAGLHVLNTDTLDLSSRDDRNPAVAQHSAALAYIIYTSGSTGKPKGIGITHATLAEHSQVARDYFGLTRADRMLQFSTINFDGFVEQLFPALTCGAAVVLRGPALWDSATFRHELLVRGITIADLPTAYWHMLAQDFARLPVAQRQYGALRQVQATGEAMPPDGVQAWRDAGLAHVKLLNSYGPTETVVTAVTQDCRAYVHGDLPLPAQMPIGQPLAGRHCYVLDANLALSPPGVPGELYIGGALLARGYLGRAGLSAERFVADPFDGAGGRLYRTGDLARWNGAGQLEYLGRTDHQVKIRGFRIELGEIEARLLAMPEVSAAVVVALAAPGGSQQLAAYVAAADLDVPSVRAVLSAQLPDYMVPASVTVLDALPLNANGKIDRKALPPPDWHAGQQHEPPQGAAEQALAAIWAEVLGHERVGRHDNFFELGGHSLTVMTLAAQLRQRHGISMPLRAVFEMPTIAALAATPALQGLNGSVNDDLAAIDALLAELES